MPKRPRLQLQLQEADVSLSAAHAALAASVASLAATDAALAVSHARLAVFDARLRRGRAALVLQDAFHRIKMQEMRQKAVAMWHMNHGLL